MLNNTVNGEIQNQDIMKVMGAKRKFKPSGLRNTPKVVAVAMTQEVKDQIQALRIGGNVEKPVNFVEFVTIKVYDGNKEQTMKKAKTTTKREIEDNEK